MQDNASNIDTAYTVRDWFAARGISTSTNWPAYSPDLNPIKHIWWHLKVRVYEMLPEVAADKSRVRAYKAEARVLYSSGVGYFG